jgi:hypothetical protein
MRRDCLPKPNTCLKVLKFQHFSSRNAPFQFDKSARFSYNERELYDRRCRVALSQFALRRTGELVAGRDVGIVRRPETIIAMF